MVRLCPDPSFKRQGDPAQSKAMEAVGSDSAWDGAAWAWRDCWVLGFAEGCMSEFALHTVWVNADQARASLERHVGPWCRQQWKGGQERLSVVIQPEEDAKTVQQGRFYWGVILKEISEQASIDGQKYSAEAWHELMKRMHLPRRKKLVRVAGKKRPVVTTTIGSTQGIGLKRMSAFIEQVIAFAQTDLGVSFSETRWENHR
jgi:hypothetical protein